MRRGSVKFFNDSIKLGVIEEEDSNNEHFVRISGLINEIQEGDNTII